MLKYLVSVTKDLLMPGILLGLLYAYIYRLYGPKGRKILTIGTIAGFAASIVMSVVKNRTRLVDLGMWNVRTFTVSLAALVLFFVFRALAKKGKGGSAVPVLAAILAFTLIFYAMPDIYALPFDFNLGGASLYSTAFFFRLIGFLLGIVVSFLACLAVDHAGKRLSPGLLGGMLSLALIVNGVQQLMKVIQVLLAKRIIPSNHTLFTLAKHSANYSDIFIYITLAVAAVIAIVLLVRSLHVNEPYDNPAQHRKIKAAWRNTKRWCALLLACCVVGVLCLTLFTSLSEKKVELSPPEECEQRGDDLYISFDQVADGHLHRFVYTTDDGVDVRFIIIKKPNGVAYGVGLDACDICGETGYYERNGQVVCSLCDVVMNVNTIGFKGGCNPIVIDYSVENGYIIVPTATLVEHQDEFTR